MARRVRTAEGQIVLEMSPEEFAGRVLQVAVENLPRWPNLFPQPNEYGYYRVNDQLEMELFRQRAALLSTGMSETAVKNVEQAGLLKAYADLAQDCPPGITAHVWRSYALIVLMQIKYGLMIDAHELAKRAKINKEEDGQLVPDVDLAEKHLRLLAGIGYLLPGQGEWSGQWKHKGLPKAWTEPLD